MNELKTLIAQKQKLQSIAMPALLGLPIVLSLSRVFREWAHWLVTPYRMLMPVYILGLLITFFKYRKTLHEIIIQKLTQGLASVALASDEQATVNEIKRRRMRINTIPWIKRNAGLLVGVAASIGVVTLLWSLAKHIGKPVILSIIFAVMAAGTIGILYFRYEYFSSREKKILKLSEDLP